MEALSSLCNAAAALSEDSDAFVVAVAAEPDALVALPDALRALAEAAVAEDAAAVFASTDASRAVSAAVLNDAHSDVL